MEKEVLDVLISQREFYCNSILNSCNEIRKIYMRMMALFVAFTAIYFDEGIISKDLTPLILAILTQAIFILLLMMFQDYSGLNVQAGLVSSTDKHINKLLNCNCLLWETQVSKHFLQKPRSASFFASSMLTVVFAICFGGVAFYSFKALSSPVFAIILVLEMAALIALLIKSNTEVAQVETFCDKLFNSPLIEDNLKHMNENSIQKGNNKQNQQVDPTVKTPVE
ncbi:hypothetical protein P4B35_22050 [Pontiellaceae bacterium B12227]|nr:hypothetical protein [Pontiellaceae bacterium B12227]